MLSSGTGQLLSPEQKFSTIDLVLVRSSYIFGLISSHETSLLNFQVQTLMGIYSRPSTKAHATRHIPPETPFPRICDKFVQIDEAKRRRASGCLSSESVSLLNQVTITTLIHLIGPKTDTTASAFYGHVYESLIHELLRANCWRDGDERNRKNYKL